MNTLFLMSTGTTIFVVLTIIFIIGCIIWGIRAERKAEAERIEEAKRKKALEEQEELEQTNL